MKEAERTLSTRAVKRSSARVNRAEVSAVCDRIEAAISGRIRIVYQPIANLYNGRIVGFESLSRFEQEPHRAPDIWFKEAASVGRGVELELAAVRAALAAAGSLPRGAYLAVNVSPQAACSPALIDILEQVPAKNLVLEITEHEAVADYEALGRALAGLRAQGMRVAIDDVGSGFSTLSHVLKIRPDVLKLDRELVTGIHRDTGRAALVASLVDFAATTGAVVIAEGVEEQAEVAALRSLGVRNGQGFHIGRPAVGFSEPVRASRALRARAVWFRMMHNKHSGRRRPLRRRFVTALMIGSLGATPVLSGMVANAEPGTGLWGARLASERIRILLQKDPAGDLALHLDFAQKRAEQLAILVRDKGSDLALITSVTSNMQGHTDEALELMRTLGSGAPASLRRRARSAFALTATELTDLVGERCGGARRHDATCKVLRPASAHSKKIVSAVHAAPPVATPSKDVTKPTIDPDKIPVTLPSPDIPTTEIVEDTLGGLEL